MIALAVIVLMAFSGLIWLSFGLVGLALHLLMAGLIGALADAAIPGKLPWGWLGAILAGLVGSGIGTRLVGHFGPSLFGVPIIPAFLGALILVGVVSLFQRRSSTTF